MALSKIGSEGLDTLSGDLIVNTSIGMGDRVMYDGDSSGTVKHFAMPKTTSRLSWGTPGSDNYRLNLSGGGALLFGVDGDSEYFAVETHQSGVGHNEKFRIDSFGRVTMPYQPAFHCNYTNGAYNVNSTIVIFPEASLNRGNHYNTSTGRFTAPVSGAYHFWCALMVSSSGNTPDFRWFKNGVSTGVAGYVSGSFGGGSWLKAHSSISIYLNVNDTIEVRTVSNVNMHIDIAANNHNQLGGFLLG